ARLVSRRVARHGDCRTMRRADEGSCGVTAPVHGQHHSVHEAGVVTGQVGDGGGDLAGGGDAGGWREGRPPGASAASWSSASTIISTPSVRVGPGETALTRTPLGPNSAAQALVSRFSAALLEPYRAMPALPNPPTMVVTLTIAPLPRAAMAGASSATRKNGTLTLIANVSSKVSSVVACVGPNEPPPALFTRMSTRQRIVAAAADLMFERGVAGTTVEDVRAAARVSSSQVYHYF